MCPKVLLTVAIGISVGGCSLQAENGIPVNHDALNVMARGNAEGEGTVLLQNGQGVSFEVNIPRSSAVEVVVRYSNDNVDELSTEVLSVVFESLDDGGIFDLGTFQTEDTGNDGFGWNVFLLSPVLLGDMIPSGRYRLVLTAVPGIPPDDCPPNIICGEIIVGDGFGIELDSVRVDFGGGSE